MILDADIVVCLILYSRNIWRLNCGGCETEQRCRIYELKAKVTNICPFGAQPVRLLLPGPHLINKHVLGSQHQHDMTWN